MKRKRGGTVTKMRRVNGFVTRLVSWMENNDVDEGTPYLTGFRHAQTKAGTDLANDLFLVVGMARNGKGLMGG